MIVKELIDDLEKGDRTKEMLKVKTHSLPNNNDMLRQLIQMRQTNDLQHVTAFGQALGMQQTQAWGGNR